MNYNKQSDNNTIFHIIFSFVWILELLIKKVNPNKIGVDKFYN